MKYCTLILPTLPLLGLTAIANTTTNQALAWGYWHGGGDSCCSDNVQTSPCCDQRISIGTDGFDQGIADATYDHQNGLTYNPIGNCLSCHSPDYWNNFREGYQHQWDTYQSTHQTVNNYVTVNGNGNDVNINNHQSSDQLSSQEPWNGQPQGCCGVTGPGEDP